MANTAHKFSEETAQQIETMSGMGMTMQMISAIIKLKHDTIYKYYSDFLATGKSKANLKVAKRIFELATDEKVPPAVQLNACMFWAKTQMGWKENMTLEVNGTVNHNSNIQINFIATNGTKQEGHKLPPKRPIPRQEIGYEQSKSWEPTFIRKHHEPEIINH